MALELLPWWVDLYLWHACPAFSPDIGAAVDSEVPEYEFSWPEVWQTWNWKTNYPSYQDLRDYFDHVDRVVGIKKDVAFNTVVVGGRFDTAAGQWTIETADGRATRAKYLILGTGFSARRYIPDWPGLDRFQGVVHHSSFWPDGKPVPVRGKRCAVIGTGASGVQIVQAWGPEAAQLTVFQRTPNLALPLRRRPLTVAEQASAKRFYPELFRYRECTFTGFLYDVLERQTLDDTPAQRQQAYEAAWAAGGFRFWVAVYKDLLTDPAANRAAYGFWADQVRARIGDPRLRELLAPRAPPHYFGIKRPCLEQTYFEQFNRPTVDVVDVQANPIRGFTETGLCLADGTVHEVDVVAVATGFDVVTGAMTQLGLHSIDGDAALQDQWADGAETYLGMTVSGYPNMFHLYGVHGPTLLSNGPSTVEVQGRWIADAIAKIEQQGIRYINPKPEAARAWKEHILDLNNATLFPTTKSTYMGGSVPGKAYEPVCYAGGIPAYRKDIRSALDSMEGFSIVK